MFLQKVSSFPMNTLQEFKLGVDKNKKSNKW